jgi:hypothetical protein
VRISKREAGGDQGEADGAGVSIQIGNTFMTSVNTASKSSAAS